MYDCVHSLVIPSIVLDKQETEKVRQDAFRALRCPVHPSRIHLKFVVILYQQIKLVTTDSMLPCI
jgi:hypothetical protein